MRALFNMPEGPYFLSHSVGCLPVAAEKSLADNYLNAWKKSGGDAWPSWVNVIAEFQGELAELLGGQSDEYCPQVNLSSGFTKFLTALPSNPSKNVIVMHAHAFPSMGYVVKALQRSGYRLKLIDETFEGDDLEAWEAALTDEVFAAVITHAHSNTGLLSPVAKLTALCRNKDVLSILDVAQSAGVIPIDLDAWQVDVVMGSCVKWLCGGPGAGFLRVDSKLLDSLEPQDVGWFSHENPFEFDIRDFRYASDARRFWGGTPSVAPYALALGSIRQMSEIGVEQIRQHNTALMEIVLNEVNSKVDMPIDLQRNGGTLCFSLDSAKVNKAEAQLKKANAYIDRRGNTLRFSLHIYNTQQEAELLAEVLSGI